MKNAGVSSTRVIISLAVSATLLGCQQSLDRPDFDPQWSSSKALEQYDNNGDGQIDQSEASAVPGWIKVFKLWDKDGDKSLSEDEITQRIERYRTASGAIASASFTVTYKRKPLAGAEVTLEPEAFMGEGFESVSSTTDSSGFVDLRCKQAKAGGYPGVYLGVYRVKISKQVDGKEIIPAKYNTETVLGFDSGAKGRLARVSPRFDLE